MSGQIYARASKDGPLIYNANPRLTQFAWFDRSGHPLGTVRAPGHYHFGPFRISPDGRSIAASVDEAGAAHMGLLEIQRGVFSGVPPSANNGFPAWAPDSRTVATYGRLRLNLTDGSSSTRRRQPVGLDSRRAPATEPQTH